MWRVFAYEPGFSGATLRAQQPPLPEVGFIFEAIKAEGDAALRRFTAEWDGVEIEGDFRVPVPPPPEIPLPSAHKAAIESLSEYSRFSSASEAPAL
jgi:hypothetical protein